MKPASFEYLRAHAVEEALAAKARHGEEARFLAGGQSLMPAMNFRLAQPAVLIDLNPVYDLAFIETGPNSLRIGAMTRYRALERDALLVKRQPLLREALPHVAHPQIRNRGTLGGNLANADPASELPAIALGLNARMRAQSARGERWIAAEDFFRGALVTALAPDEMLTEVELPDPPPRSGCCFMEVARRRGDFALMGVAAIIALDPDGRCSDARLALCSAGDRPVNAKQAAASLVGSRVTDADVAGAAAAVQGAIEPVGNIHASKGFQRHLAGVLTRRAVQAALQRARAAAAATDGSTSHGP
jgi:carbon-monoxide dehydrogenase medium subunit